jgi:hypothetical protein
MRPLISSSTASTSIAPLPETDYFAASRHGDLTTADQRGATGTQILQLKRPVFAS